VRRVVAVGEIALDQLGETTMELNLGLVRLAALGAGLVVPALDPEQHDGDQTALELGAS
jgi:hypothetical protein